MSAQRSHVIPKVSLRHFATEEECIAMHQTGRTGRVLTGLNVAGVRRGMYEMVDDSGRRDRRVETHLAEVEGAVADILRNPDPSRLGSEERAYLGYFIGLQIVRGMAWREHHDERLVEHFGELVDGAVDGQVTFPSGRSASVAHVARVGEGLLDDQSHHLKRMLALAEKFGSLVASMHWTMLRFEAPLLCTSDEPVVLWPLLPGSRRPGPIPWRAGAVKTLELRYPLTAHVALLGCWAEQEEAGGFTPAKMHHAANLNAFTIAQAEKQWFAHPDIGVLQGGTMLPPLSPEFVPGYGPEAAVSSRRREETSEMVQPRLGNDPTGEIHFLCPAA